MDTHTPAHVYVNGYLNRVRVALHHSMTACHVTTAPVLIVVKGLVRVLDDEGTIKPIRALERTRVCVVPVCTHLREAIRQHAKEWSKWGV